MKVGLRSPNGNSLGPDRFSAETCLRRVAATDVGCGCLIWLFLQTGGPFCGVFVINALLLGVYTLGPLIFVKLSAEGYRMQGS